MSMDAWLGDTETTSEQREALKAASDMVTARYHPDLEDSRVNALNGAAAVILGDATLESIAAEYQAARRVEREQMETLTGAMIAAAILAGMETETTPAPKWKVGDPDPTPTSSGRINCIATTPDGRFVCTWPAGHPGQHVAGTGFEVVAVWDDDDDDDHALQGDPITSTTS